VAVAGLDRQEWTGESYSDDEFRELAEVLPGLPLQGTGGLGSRVWSGPAITVTGIDVPSVANALNAVSPHARAKLNLRVHPAQDAKEAQAALVRHLEAVRPFGIALEVHAEETGNGFAADTTGPAYEAARIAYSQAWGTPAVNAAGGGSIPLVSALQAAAPSAEVLLVGATDGYSNIHAPDERVLLSELEKATLAEATFFGEYASRWS
jgi:acetylornithine deacetylase/succinyl-diaminopimelate desuccinylase-like protein